MAKKKEEVADEDQQKIDLEATVLFGNTRDDILNLFKQKADWGSMKENQQKEVIASCEHIAKEIVRRASNIIAARGFRSFHCTLDSVTIKDGIKIVLKASKNAEGRQSLLESQGGSVTVVMSDINQYLGQRNAPKIDKDQPDLGLEDDDEEE